MVAESDYETLRPRLLDPIVDKRDRVESRCPVHPDCQGKAHRKPRPSLVLFKETGRLFCWGGCRWQDVKDALLGDLSHRGTDPRPHLTPVGSPESTAELKTAEYVYHTADGRSATKERWERADGSKRFVWRQEDGTVGLDGLGQSDFLLWNYEALAARPNDDVFFCEGEKAAQALIARGKLAVCLGFGANQKVYGSALSALASRTVRLWADNDPAGHEYMQAIEVALRAGITRRITWVTVPLPDKGDAWDYFAGGGSLESLEENRVDQPIVQVTGPDAVTVIIPTPNGAIRFAGESIATSNQKFEVDLEVNLIGFLAEDLPHVTRVNLLSSSARDGLRKELDGRWPAGKDGHWTATINKVSTLMRRAYMEIDRSQRPDDVIEGNTQARWLVRPLLAEGAINILFGPAETGKTFLGLAICAIVGAAASVAGLECDDPGQGVLYVDYEGGDEWWGRWNAILHGAAIDLRPPHVHRWPAVAPLSEEIEAIQRKVVRDGVSLVVIDSALASAGGRPEEAEVANRFFGALRRLPKGTTVLVLAHPNKQEVNPIWPFGSIVYYTMPRLLVRANKLESSTPDETKLFLHFTKGNNGRRPKDFGLAIKFSDHDEDGVARCVKIERHDPRADPTAAVHFPLADRIDEYLKQGDTTIKLIASALDVKVDTVRKELVKRGDRFVRITAGKGGAGNELIWGRKASRDATEISS